MRTKKSVNFRYNTTHIFDFLLPLRKVDVWKLVAGCIPNAQKNFNCPKMVYENSRFYLYKETEISYVYENEISFVYEN